MEFPDLVRLCATYMRTSRGSAVSRMFVVMRAKPPLPPALHALFDLPTERIAFSQRAQ